MHIPASNLGSWDALATVNGHIAIPSYRENPCATLPTMTARFAMAIRSGYTMPWCISRRSEVFGPFMSFSAKGSI